MSGKAKTVEDYINELKSVTDAMKNENLTLDESMKLYRQGIETAKKAEKLLAEYRGELEQLSAEAEND